MNMNIIMCVVCSRGDTTERSAFKTHALSCDPIKYADMSSQSDFSLT